VSLQSAVSAAGHFVGAAIGKVTSGVVKETAPDGALNDELTKIRDAIDDVREAAASAIVKAGVGGSVKAAAKVGPKGNKYETLLPFLEDPEKRKLATIAGFAILVAVIVYFATRRHK